MSSHHFTLTLSNSHALQRSRLFSLQFVHISRSLSGLLLGFAFKVSEENIKITSIKFHHLSLSLSHDPSSSSLYFFFLLLLIRLARGGEKNSWLEEDDRWTIDSYFYSIGWRQLPTPPFLLLLLRASDNYSNRLIFFFNFRKMLKMVEPITGKFFRSDSSFNGSKTVQVTDDYLLRPDRILDRSPVQPPVRFDFLIYVQNFYTIYLCKLKNAEFTKKYIIPII